jgi:hypothetical protein
MHTARWQLLQQGLTLVFLRWRVLAAVGGPAGASRSARQRPGRGVGCRLAAAAAREVSAPLTTLAADHFRTLDGRELYERMCLLHMARLQRCITW